MKVIVFVIIFLTISKTMRAQHCPFDGMHLIAIKVVDKQGKMVTNFNAPFYLAEVDNPMADSCTSAAGLIKKQFLIKDTFIAECGERFNRNGYDTELINRLKTAGVFIKANRMLTINQAENTCTLIGKSETAYTNYIYRQRRFVFAYMVNNKEIRLPVPDNLIYDLCTSAKGIEKFKPLVIKL
jgi:hypothetical protein